MMGLDLVLENFNHVYEQLLVKLETNFLIATTTNICMENCITFLTRKIFAQEINFKNINCKHIFEFKSKNFYMNAVKSLNSIIEIFNDVTKSYEGSRICKLQSYAAHKHT